MTITSSAAVRTVLVTGLPTQDQRMIDPRAAIAALDVRLPALAGG